MHCATLDIKAKDDYTLIPFMLIFRRPAVFSPSMPFISRSIALLLIFTYSQPSLRFWRVLEALAASYLCLTGVAPL